MTGSCQRPADFSSAWIYWQISDNRTILIDPFSPYYQNNTIVHYKCKSTDFSEENEEASAISCKNGEWQALLSPCGEFMFQI